MASVKIDLKDKTKKIDQDAVTSPYKIFYKISSHKEWNYLSDLKNRTCLSFFLLKIFEFHCCSGNYASSAYYSIKTAWSKAVVSNFKGEKCRKSMPVTSQSAQQPNGDQNGLKNGQSG